ncbi:MAG: di-trans,poly-cis-decaprenylcistransferase [Gammaproteobacteria bacterium]|nr:di-trans,poly-cis-decaprenylcistransferase [Gammaproteobacteria bacterium]
MTPEITVQAPEDLAAANSADMVPKHVGIIMDGNHRWAKKRHLPGAAGHRAGAKGVRVISEACVEMGIKNLTLFAFSTENWYRPEGEVSMLMDLMRYVMRTDIEDLHAQGVKLRIIGDRSRFAEDIHEMMDDCEALTRNNQRLNLNVAVNYGGRWDIVEASKALALRVQNGEIAADDINESMLHQHMSLGDLPEPDLLIRTGGDFRVSNFMLWDIAYTELYFTEAFWPEFDGGHLRSAVETFSARLRRFGRRA